MKPFKKTLLTLSLIGGLSFIALLAVNARGSEPSTTLKHAQSDDAASKTKYNFSLSVFSLF